MSSQQAVPSASDSPFSIRSILAPLITVIIGMFMVILDSTLVNVALHELEQELRSSLSTIQWTVTGYTLALSAVIPIAGWMMDKFGTKRIFLFTIALFTIGSALCATAQSIEQLIIYRIIQGLGGGMVIPIGMAIIFRLAPPERRGAVMAMIGIPMLVAPALGPVLSGWLIGFASWHWLFWINVPIGVIGVLIGIKHLPMFEQNKALALDIPGMILAPVAFTMLAFSVSEGGRTGWTSNLALSGLLIGGIALLLFIFVELRHKQPLLELRVFRSSGFTRGILLMWIAQICLFSVTILVPLFLQSVKHFTPLQTGLTVLPQAIAAMIFMSIGGTLYDKFGARPLTISGFSIVAGALFLFSLIDLDTPIIMVLVPLFMMGTGMGLTVMTLETYVLSSAPPTLVNRVTPLTTATLQVATSFAVAGLTGFLTFRTGEHAMNAGPNNHTLQAAIAAYGDTFLLSAGLAIVGVVISIILRKPKVEAKDELLAEGHTI
ncbi:MDR family MFS transporter [Cohnella sp. REN36]|uniref:MDR family MFS transporter n=1 Tax=Cohnella sp. REN36 TaxID=2887347 RepID=UPI001D13ED14|nr:MDR family MFS transporter [Cohnella sp. REN36]MCC3373602.1 multidrug efflux MFS transporter [Cohnella sp. REN36]